MLLFVVVSALLLAHPSSGLVHSRAHHTRQRDSSSASRPLRSTAAYLEDLSTSTAGADDGNAQRAAEANSFQAALHDADLSSCHGLLHSIGCRRLSDVRCLTLAQIDSLGLDASDRSIIDNLHGGGYIRPIVEPSFASSRDFGFEAICAENDIYKGRLFTPEQCNQIKVLAERHAYQNNPGWIGMPCKNVPGMIDTTDGTFRELFEGITHSLFGGRMRVGSLRFESHNEPHLVRYIGDAVGAPLHKDTDHKSLTLNVLLSDNTDFGGGGTFIEVIDRTTKLEQGEMLIHPGNLQHAGADISFGVRHLLVAFLECEWEDTATADDPIRYQQ